MQSILPIAPGEHIREELEARGWTQTQFAEIIGRPLPAVNNIVRGRRAITIQSAQEIAAAFGTTAQLWLSLEMEYQLALNRDPVDTEAIRKRAEASG